MGKNSKIEWCSHTFNPWRGCTKVSDGCKNCYAETMSKRSPKTLGVWGDNGTRVIASQSYWKQPLRWNREAHAAGERQRVFCASLADVFEDRPELDAPRLRLLALIESTPFLDWLLLTKRPENVMPLIERAQSHASVVPNPRAWLLRNPWVWIGTSVENQKELWRVDELRKIPSSVRFLSVEPLLEDLGKVDLTGIHWMIVGGESGAGARPLHPDWARSLRDQCQTAGVPFFMKQGSQANWPSFKDFSSFPEELQVREFPSAIN